MSRTVKFYFDFVSPYSYLASTQIEAVAARTGSSVDYLPIHVGTLMKKVGDRPTTIECNAKSQYALSDLGRWAQRYRVPVVMNPIFGRFDTRPLLQTAISAKADGQAKAAVAALFQGMWVEKSTFESDDVIVALLKGHGVANADALVAAGNGHADTLASLTEEAEAHGAFGAPSFVVNGTLLFGNDRIDFLEEALRS